MKPSTSKSRLLLPVILGLLAACSGGGVNISVHGPAITPLPPPPTSTEAVTAHGVITGYGDITVNDIRYAANGAIVTVNDRPAILADLLLGQVVTLSGRISSNGWSGTANSIRVDANVIGPVESVDAPNNRMLVMGQSVIADSGTAFGPGIDPQTYAGLSAGSNVQISGFANATGTINATRIDRDTTSSEQRVIGRVAGLDLANLLFTVNRLTVDYSSPLVIDLPGGAPSNGMMIKVTGTMSGGRLIAERLVSAPSLTGAAGQRVRTAGVITRYNSQADFDINHAAVAVKTGTTFFNGTAGDLALNAEIVVDGNFASSGRITANRITFGRINNATATLDFDFSGFTEVSVSTVFNVTITQGPIFSVEVIVDEDAANRVAVNKTGSRLNIALSQGDGNIETLQAIVTMPVLNRIELTGVVNASLNNFQQSQLTATVSGVSRLHGNALMINDLTANVSGVSQLSFGNIRPIAYASIDVSGVSQATLNMGVGSTLTGSVGTGQGTGVSTLFYYGTSVTLNVTTDFLSSVVKLGETKP